VTGRREEAGPPGRIEAAAPAPDCRIAALRDRLRRMLDDPAAAEALARALKSWMRRSGP
jgi:hypothetical protein